jgi:uncharacterized membrane protein
MIIGRMSILIQWWGWAVGLAVLLLLVLLAIWITSQNQRFHQNYNSAMKLITDKYHNGEIDEEEYENLVKDLKMKTGSGIKQPGRLDKDE